MTATIIPHGVHAALSSARTAVALCRAASAVSDGTLPVYPEIGFFQEPCD